MIAAALLALAAGTPAAGAFADPAEIDRAVADFTGAPAATSGGARVPVDRRLRLAACAQPLAVSWHTPAQTNVVVQCPDGAGWRLFVSIRSAGTATSAAPVILRGDPVTISVPGAGFSVSQPGEALEAGSAGAWIKVRGPGVKAQPVRARVVRPGLVELPLD